jgi:hypothetical protein
MAAVIMENIKLMRYFICVHLLKFLINRSMSNMVPNNLLQTTHTMIHIGSRSIDRGKNYIHPAVLDSG